MAYNTALLLPALLLLAGLSTSVPLPTRPAPQGRPSRSSSAAEHILYHPSPNRAAVCNNGGLDVMINNQTSITPEAGRWTSHGSVMAVSVQQEQPETAECSDILVHVNSTEENQTVHLRGGDYNTSLYGLSDAVPRLLTVGDELYPSLRVSQSLYSHSESKYILHYAVCDNDSRTLQQYHPEVMVDTQLLTPEREKWTSHDGDGVKVVSVDRPGCRDVLVHVESNSQVTVDLRISVRGKPAPAIRTSPYVLPLPQARPTPSPSPTQHPPSHHTPSILPHRTALSFPSPPSTSAYTAAGGRESISRTLTMLATLAVLFLIVL